MPDTSERTAFQEAREHCRDVVQEVSDAFDTFHKGLARLEDALVALAEVAQPLLDQAKHEEARQRVLDAEHAAGVDGTALEIDVGPPTKGD